MALLGRLSFLWTMALVASCGTMPHRALVGGKEHAPSRPASGDGAHPETSPAKADGAQSQGFWITPANLIPETSPSAIVGDPLSDGSRRYVVSGIRLTEHENGAIERAREVLPDGRVRILDLPARLGGGVLIAVVASGGTEVFRAENWLGPVSPLSSLPQATTDWVAGFDRVYARTGDVRTSFGDLLAMDPVTGQRLEIDPLPPVSRVGMVAFSDPWRAVVVVDLLGALATFDAGVSWRPVFPDGRGVNKVTALPSGEFALDTTAGRFLLGLGGEVIEDAPAPHAGEAAEGSRRTTGPLGRRPQRTALVDGWPESASTVVVARGSALYRVRIADGSILETKKQPLLGADAQCHALALGSSFGFLCAGADGSTSLYAFEPPLSLRLVLHDEVPRFVTASGTGGVAVRGPCGDHAGKGAGLNDGDAKGTYCVLARDGASRELRLYKGSETDRIAVLADGRVAVLTPPWAGTPGELRVFEGNTERRGPLVLPPDTPDLAHFIWLNSLEETAPGVLGTWIEVRHVVVGVRIALDGSVVIGQGGGDVETTSISGRFALDWGKSRRAAESVDGGMTWNSFELPAFEIPPVTTKADAVACGPAGCVGRGWLRVGWSQENGGKSAAKEEGIERAPTPKPDGSSRRLPQGITLRCEPTREVPKARVELPRQAKHLAPPRTTPVGKGPPLATASFGLGAALAPAASNVVKTPWAAFRGLAAPSLAKGEVGLDVGSEGLVATRLYAWGPKGADWLRSGRWVARFDDRFSQNGVRTTAITNAPFHDEERAAEVLGVSTSSLLTWNAKLEPSGHGAILFGKRGPLRSDLYQAVAGEPLVPWRDAEGAALPEPTSVVRVGASWFFLSYAAGSQPPPLLTLWRVDGGVARRLARFPRLTAPTSEPPPTLVRRAEGGGLGLLVLGAPRVSRASRDWYVYPLDAEAGTLAWPERLMPNDLGGQVPSPCTTADDGWLVDALPMPLAPIVVGAPGDATLPDFSSLELRLRLEVGRACVDAIAARIDRLTPPPAPLPGASARAADYDPSTAIALVATDETSGQRWGYRCWP